MNRYFAATAKQEWAGKMYHVKLKGLSDPECEDSGVLLIFILSMFLFK